MLIICPECGKEISDKSDKCIHCGYPLSKTKSNIIIINNKEYDFTDIILGIESEEYNPAVYIREISDMCLIPIYEAKEIYFNLKNNKTLSQHITCDIKEQQNIPKCPTCQSNNIGKISTTSKAINTVAFGLLGTKRHKSFHCNNCGYEW